LGTKETPTIHNEYRSKNGIDIIPSHPAFPLSSADEFMTSPSSYACNLCITKVVSSSNLPRNVPEIYRGEGEERIKETYVKM
jgi:hypothetical protein